jgi:hypothetical protein
MSDAAVQAVPARGRTGAEGAALRPAGGRHGREMSGTRVAVLGGMRLPRSVFLVFVVASLSAGCAYARGIRVGEGAAPRPPGCQLAYEHLSPAQAQARWRQVGDVCVSYGQLNEPSVAAAYQPGEMRDALDERACALGGEIVSPVGLCSNGKANGIEFGVYVGEP